MEISNIKKQISNKKNGYTLIEILVALAIIGLLFSFGYVSFRDFSRRQEVSGAAKGIQGDLRLAQGDAISGQKSSGCSGVLDGYSFLVAPPSEYKIQANCGAAPIDVKDVTLPSDVTISVPFPSPNPLNFKVLGQGTNITGDSPWTLKLTQTGTGNSVEVTVTSGGEIK